ncbi:MAG: hypothetical protein ACK4Z0_01955 [Sphingomonadaceae bacterium]
MRVPAFALLLLAAAPARADAALDRLRAEARATAPKPFERTIRIEPANRPAIVQVDRFDPRAPKGRQWTLLSVDGRAPTEDEIRRHQRETGRQPVPGFHRLNELLAGPPTAIERQGERTIYRWQALQPGAVTTGQGPDFSERLSAEAVVSGSEAQPRLERVRIYAAQPFGIMGVARMNRFEAISFYATEGERHRLARQTTEVDARVPIQGNRAQKSTTTFRAL